MKKEALPDSHCSEGLRSLSSLDFGEFFNLNARSPTLKRCVFPGLFAVPAMLHHDFEEAIMPYLARDAVVLLRCWSGWGQLREGLLSVFVETPTGRRFLFELGPGDRFFGGGDLLAIAEEETWIAALDTDPGGGDWEEWSGRFQAFFQERGIALVLDEDREMFYVRCGEGWQLLAQQEMAADRQRLREKGIQSQRFHQRAIADLTGIFQKTDSLVPPVPGEGLEGAVRLVGEALGLTLTIPPLREGSLYSPLHQIAFASRVRLRRVKLRGEWWRSDGGTLLGYRRDGSPVALLALGDRYVMVNPQDRTRQVVTRQTADHLQPWAYFFYRPLPEKVLTTWDIVRFAIRGRRREILSITVIGIIGALVAMITPLMTGLLIERAIPNGDRRLLITICLGLGAVSLGSTLFNIAQGIAVARLQTFADLDTHTAVWDRLLKLRAPFFRQYNVGDLQSRVSAIAQIRQMMSGTVLQSIFSSIFSLLTLGLMLVYSPPLTGFVVLTVLAIVGVTNTLSLQTRRQLKPLQEMQGQLSGLMVQMFTSVGKLRVAGAEKRAFAFWAHRLHHILRLSLSTATLEDSLVLFNTAVSVLSPLLLFSLGATAIASPLNGDLGRAGLSTALFLAFNSAAGLFLGAISQLGSIVVRLVEISILWERAQPILTTLPEVTPQQKDPGRLRGDLHCEKLFFRYAPHTPWVLAAIDLDIQAGELVAIVGDSGSGKSTLARLLLGFEQPDQGAIYYDRQNLADLDVTAVRRQLGVVLQNGRLEGTSIFDNLAMGSDISKNAAWEALRLAGIADDIAQLPMGLDTRIAEGGITFSGGQRQRLLIARAIVRQPRLLIFDEATSFLDNQTQAIVTENLQQLNITRIIIAHRLSTIAQADRIYVLERGTICQQGTFASLMNQPGPFQTLMQYQQPDPFLPGSSTETAPPPNEPKHL